MTDAVALLLNLVTLKESGQGNFKLEVSRAHYDDLVLCKSVTVNGVQVCVVDLGDLVVAAKDWSVLSSDVLERYTTPLRVIMPKFVHDGKE